MVGKWSQKWEEEAKEDEEELSFRMGNSSGSSSPRGNQVQDDAKQEQLHEKNENKQA